MPEPASGLYWEELRLFLQVAQAGSFCAGAQNQSPDYRARSAPAGERPQHRACGGTSARRKVDAGGSAPCGRARQGRYRHRRGYPPGVADVKQAHADMEAVLRKSELAWKKRWAPFMAR
jgi:hypothetical protein